MDDLIAPRLLTWRDFAAAAILALVLLAGVSQRMVPGVVGVMDDDAVIAVTAMAMADGEGYRLTNLPGAPRQTKYPVLYPAVLALASRAFEEPVDRVFAMQAATAALGALGVALAFLYSVRFGVSGRVPAFAGGLLTVSAPNVLFYCSTTLSEMPFLVVLVTALWVMQGRLRSTTEDFRRDLLAGIVVGLPMLCRTAGAVVPVAAIVVLLGRRRPVRGVALGAFLVGLPWAIWASTGVSIANDRLIGYQTDYLGWWQSHFSLAVPVTNLQGILEDFSKIEFEGLARWLGGQLGAGVRWVLLAVGIVPWVGMLVTRRSFALLPTMLVLYALLLGVWPWPPDRFLVPMLPFLAASAIEGTLALATRLKAPRIGAVALATFLAVGIAANVSTLLLYSAESRGSHYPYLTLTDAPVQWESYREAFAWIREHTSPGDVLAAGFDPMTALYSGRAVIRPFELRPLSMYYGGEEPMIGDVEEFGRHLIESGARYMLLTPLPAYRIETAFFELVYAAADRRPSILRPVWQRSEDPRFVLFEVQSGSAR